MRVLGSSQARSTLLALAATVPQRLRATEQRRSAAAIASAAMSGGEHTILCSNAADTQALGAAIADVARAGDVILLRGDYGAGKTCLARGFVRHWYSDPDELVTSPSYLIDNEYPDEGRALHPGVTVHHMDLWRLPDGKASQLIDLERVFDECISLIEWPDKLGNALPSEHLAVHLAIDQSSSGAIIPSDDLDDDEYEQPRIAIIKPTGSRWHGRLSTPYFERHR